MSLYQITQKLTHKIFPNWSRKAYSQEGEDLIMARFLEGQASGFYVDVGAHHPKRFSNTYYFYLKGWRGLNIDATPGSMQAFNKHRPRDINIETPVGLSDSELEYYQFNEPALNTFDSALAQERQGLNANYKVIRKDKLQIRRLDKLLDENLPSGTNIDFLTIDVEGLDLEVLKSNDWEKYRPNFVLIEVLKNDMNRLNEDPCIQLLQKQGYELAAKAVNTVILRKLNSSHS